MAASALSPSSHQRDFSGSRAGTPGVPFKAERLLALGDNHRPNVKRASYEGNRLLALLTANKKELNKPPNSELLNTGDWTVNDLFDTNHIWSFPVSNPASKSGALRKQPPQSPTPETYYDSSKVPLRVSQQTSASAMRDMGLHKQSVMLEQPLTMDRRVRSSTLGTDPRRQKLDKLLGATDYPSHSNAKLDITSYFTTTRPTPSPDAYRAPSAWTPTSDQSADAPPSLSELQKRPVINRSGDSRLKIGPPQLVSYNSTVSLRPLPRAEEDVLKNAKMHRRRPPKGASNWFDGLDVSSDEDDFGEEDDFDSMQLQPRPQTPPSVDRRVSIRMSRLEDQQPARRSRDLHHASSEDRSGLTGQRRSLHASRSLADLKEVGQAYSMQGTSSHPTNDSVFSLESNDDFDVDLVGSDPETRRTTLDGVHYGEDAKVMELSKVRAKRLSHHPSYQKDPFSSRNESMSTDVTSGTIPMRLASDLYHPQRPRTSARYSSAAHIAPHLVSSEVPPPVPGQPRSSISSEGARMMEVTDEEMALLEMMRQKRATMSKTSSPDAKPGSRQSRETSTRSSIGPKSYKLFPQNFSHDLDHTDALTALRKEYGLLQENEYELETDLYRQCQPLAIDNLDVLQPRSYTPQSSMGARSNAASSHRTRENVRSISHAQRPMTAHANAGNLVAPRPLSPDSAGRAQNTHKRSLSQQGRTPILDLHIPAVPAIPQRNPNRTSLLPPSRENSDNDDSDSQRGGITIPHTPADDDTRQSYCSTLPDTAPLSLPTLSSAVYRPDAPDSTTIASSKESGPRPSPQVILSNSFQQSSQSPERAQPTRSFTSPPRSQDLLPPMNGHIIRKPSDPSIYESRQLNPLCMNNPMEFVERNKSPSSEGTRFSQLARPGSLCKPPEHGLTHSPSATVSPDTPDTPVGPQPLRPGLQPGPKPRQLASSPTIESLKQSAADNSGGNRGSMISMTSVGEDVLAAWAELGGGTLHFRF